MLLLVLGVMIGGIAAGFVATRLLRIEADLLTTAAIGVLGTIGGILAVRFLVAGLTLFGWIAAALAGAFLVSWLYKIYVARS